MQDDVAGPDGSELSDRLGRVIDNGTRWQEKCSRCKHLLRSGDDGNVWHCAAVRAGKGPVYAVTARAETWRKTAPARGKCGRGARLFQAA